MLNCQMTARSRLELILKVFKNQISEIEKIRLRKIWLELKGRE